MAWVRVLTHEAFRWASRGVDLVFPPRCPICREEHPADPGWGDPDAGQPGQGADGGDWADVVCPRCDRSLASEQSRCLWCAAPGARGDGCRSCRRRRRDWRRAVVLSSYSGPLREAVLRAKRPSGDDVAVALATLLVRRHREMIAGFGADAVVPVPMHWMRRSLRGTSVAERIAGRIAASLRLPCTSALVRHRATRMQNELPAELRAGNVAGAFRARLRLDGARILLVDDVMTTGATLSACARALTAAGAAGVDVAVLARADATDGDADD